MTVYVCDESIKTLIVLDALCLFVKIIFHASASSRLSPRLLHVVDRYLMKKHFVF